VDQLQGDTVSYRDTEARIQVIPGLEQQDSPYRRSHTFPHQASPVERNSCTLAFVLQHAEVTMAGRPAGGMGRVVCFHYHDNSHGDRLSSTKVLCPVEWGEKVEQARTAEQSLRVVSSGGPSEWKEVGDR